MTGSLFSSFFFFFCFKKGDIIHLLPLGLVLTLGLKDDKTRVGKSPSLYTCQTQLCEEVACLFGHRSLGRVADNLPDIATQRAADKKAAVRL